MILLLFKRDLALEKNYYILDKEVNLETWEFYKEELQNGKKR